MNQPAEQLFWEMRKDIEHCRKKDLGPLCELECCFQMAERYWAKLRQEVSSHEFSTVADEVEFFKTIKPKFTSEVDYYSLLYHAELFRRDVQDTVELTKFWTREKHRLKRFRLENEEFFDYYKAGRTDMDEEYFVRRNSDLSNFPKARVYDLEEKAATSHDPLVSMIIALERYIQFIEEEMKVLHESKRL